MSLTRTSHLIFPAQLQWPDSLSTRVVGPALPILNFWNGDVELRTLTLHLEASPSRAHLPTRNSRPRAQESHNVAWLRLPSHSSLCCEQEMEPLGTGPQATLRAAHNLEAIGRG